MSVTTSNLILGPGTLYWGVFGAAEPLDTAINTTPQASAWTDVGGTQGGVALEINQTYTELDVDQVVDVPESRVTKREMTIKTNLAEPTLANLALAMNVTAPVTGASVDTLEPNDDVSSTQPNYKALLFDGFAPGSFRRRIICRKTLQNDKVDFSYTKEDQTVFSVTFAVHYVSSSIKPYKILDAKSAS